MNTKNIFCANCQIETEQRLELATLDILGQPLEDPGIVASCPVCSRQLKFPSTVTPTEFDALLAEHKEANQGQEPAVTVEPEPVTLAPEPEAPAESVESEPVTTVTPSEPADPVVEPPVEPQGVPDAPQPEPPVS